MSYKLTNPMIFIRWGIARVLIRGNRYPVANVLPGFFYLVKPLERCNCVFLSIRLIRLVLLTIIQNAISSDSYSLRRQLKTFISPDKTL